MLRANVERLDSQDKVNAQVLDLLASLEKKIDHITYTLHVDFPETGKGFPLDHEDDLEKFLSNDDGMYDQRRREFEMYLSTAIPSKPNPKTFGNLIMNALFTVNFLSRNRWPHAWYCNKYTFKLDKI